MKDYERNISAVTMLGAGAWAIYAVFTNDVVVAIISMGIVVSMLIDVAERSIVAAIKGKK
jgi:hypothetical protein